jgi:hypothetical protein
MTVFDPLVSVEPSAQAGLRGWAVAAAIIARLQEVGLSDGIDVPAILGPAISDLSESELEELARHLFGPLMDISRCLLGHHVREWLAALREGGPTSLVHDPRQGCLLTTRTSVNRARQ